MYRRWLRRFNLAFLIILYTTKKLQDNSCIQPSDSSNYQSFTIYYDTVKYSAIDCLVAALTSLFSIKLRVPQNCSISVVRQRLLSNFQPSNFNLGIQPFSAALIILSLSFVSRTFLRFPLSVSSFLDGLDALEQQCINAHPTIITVLEVLSSADTTKPLFYTEVRKLIHSHPQVTNVAVICSKLDIAVHTIVGFARLSRVALSTDDFGNGESIDVVMSLFVLKVHGK